MKRIRLMAAKLFQKENVDPADLANLAELLLPYRNKRPLRDAQLCDIIVCTPTLCSMMLCLPSLTPEAVPAGRYILFYY